MALLNIIIHSDVDDSFDSEKLKNFGYMVNYTKEFANGSNKSNVKSILCEKTSSLNETEIERACNTSVNLNGMGLTKIHYIQCKIIETKPKPIPTWRKPLAIIGYETVGVALLLGITAGGSLSGDMLSAIIGVIGSVASYSVYQILTYLKRNSI
jgi:hypothetical protein